MMMIKVPIAWIKIFEFINRASRNQARAKKMAHRIRRIQTHYRVFQDWNTAQCVSDRIWQKRFSCKLKHKFISKQDQRKTNNIYGDWENYLAFEYVFEPNLKRWITETLQYPVLLHFDYRDDPPKISLVFISESDYVMFRLTHPRIFEKFRLF